MTFRIDHVFKQHSGIERVGRWEWHIKGLGGHGIYCTLSTGANGHGLYLVNLPEHEQILGPGLFAVPPEASYSEAKEILVKALLGMGWGPEVDQHNKMMKKVNPGTP